MPQKLFRDPVHDYIAIDLDKYSWLFELINCPEVQRLRYISQLGLSHFTYPGSTHSRFSHSLGVLHLMQQCISHLKQDYSQNFNTLDEEALLAAALLHDIGHGPFSHATESLFDKHDERTFAIIVHPESGVHKVLRAIDKELPAKAGALIAEKPRKNASQPPLWQKSLISSQLDMDRLDYLRRDSLASGAEYGNFDWLRILRTMTLQKKTMERQQQRTLVVWPEKTKYALEEYIFARFYMYQSVYFHHTTRGFEQLLQKILQRGQELASRCDKTFNQNILPPLRPFLVPTQQPEPNDFLYLTDHIVMAQVTLWQNDDDEILSDLTQRLLFRTGIAWVEIQDISMEIINKIAKAQEYLQKQGKDDNYYLFKDQSKALIYKPYSPASETKEQSSVTSIMLYDSSWEGTGFKEISDLAGMERLKAITAAKPSPIIRYYFPKEHERQIKKLLS